MSSLSLAVLVSVLLSNVPAISSQPTTDDDQSLTSSQQCVWNNEDHIRSLLSSQRQQLEQVFEQSNRTSSILKLVRQLHEETKYGFDNTTKQLSAVLHLLEGTFTTSQQDQSQSSCNISLFLQQICQQLTEDFNNTSDHFGANSCINAQFTQQILLSIMLQRLEEISAQLKDKKYPENIGLNKSHAVSKLTEKCLPLLIQQKVDSSDSFNRSWEEYRDGFEDSSGNYWLGNELLSQLTLYGGYALRVNIIKRQNGSDWFHARYNQFMVLSEASNYTMYASGFTSIAPLANKLDVDALSEHNGMKFSTYDRDNDLSEDSNCASSKGGGFWYGNCSQGNPNADADFAWSGMELQLSRMWLQCTLW